MLLLAVSAAGAMPTDIDLKRGDKLEEATVIAIEEKGLRVKHSKGTRLVPFGEVAEASFPFDAEAVRPMGPASALITITSNINRCGLLIRANAGLVTDHGNERSRESKKALESSVNAMKLHLEVIGREYKSLDGLQARIQAEGGDTASLGNVRSELLGGALALADRISLSEAKLKGR